MEIAYQQHQTQPQVCTLRKRKAEDTLDHQTMPKRDTGATHWGERHSPEIQGNIRPKRPYEDTLQRAAIEPPKEKKPQNTTSYPPLPKADELAPGPDTTWGHGTKTVTTSTHTSGPRDTNHITGRYGDRDTRRPNSTTPAGGTPPPTTGQPHYLQNGKNGHKGAAPRGLPHMYGPTCRHKPELRPQAQAVPGMCQRPPIW